MMRPDRFTEKAQEVLAASQELVQSMNHTQWDIEHILLAIMQQNKSLGVEILEIAVSYTHLTLPPTPYV